MIRNLDAWLDSLSQNVVLLLSLTLAVGVGVIDYFLAVDVLALYLAPLYVAARYGGKRAGIVIAVYSAAAAVASEALFLEVFNMLDWKAYVSFAVRLLTYLFVVLVIDSLHLSRVGQERLTQFIVHDLRSPVASSITGLQTLQAISEDLTDDQREMIDLALVSNQRTLTLVNSILDVAKLESGTMEFNRETVQVKPFIEEVVQQVLLWAQGFDVQIRTEVHVEQAVLDPMLTSRVLVNLLSNALKYSPAGSEIVVRADQSGDQVRFSIADQGPGIPIEYRDTIFEPFTQVKGTRGGTGLGLSFCRLAVAGQKGRIWIEDNHPRGTVMVFSLPALVANESSVQSVNSSVTDVAT